MKISKLLWSDDEHSVSDVVEVIDKLNKVAFVVRFANVPNELQTSFPELDVKKVR